ncbi:hypothetical protein HU200_031250 [Digitaria exilis]|uniref:Uncharacterized protein n=1 Tax=Digitaria exilis TaxID=1010633 RepID=A0A835BQ95_9POAL|nr:hypothetical protein HU200_031250 [Digitaria exilis]
MVPLPSSSGRGTWRPAAQAMISAGVNVLNNQSSTHNFSPSGVFIVLPALLSTRPETAAIPISKRGEVKRDGCHSSRRLRRRARCGGGEAGMTPRLRHRGAPGSGMRHRRFVRAPVDSLKLWGSRSCRLRSVRKQNEPAIVLPPPPFTRWSLARVCLGPPLTLGFSAKSLRRGGGLTGFRRPEMSSSPPRPLHALSVPLPLLTGLNVCFEPRLLTTHWPQLSQRPPNSEKV